MITQQECMDYPNTMPQKKLIEDFGLHVQTEAMSREERPKASQGKRGAHAHYSD